MESLQAVSDVIFVLLGAILVLFMHSGFAFLSAQTVAGVSGLVAMNSLMAMAGGAIAALLAGRADPGFLHNGPLAGLVAVCAGSDVMHPIGSLIVGGVAGALFVGAFTLAQNRLRIDDVLGVWPLHGLCGAWGGIAAGIFGATISGFAIYGTLRRRKLINIPTQGGRPVRPCIPPNCVARRLNGWPFALLAPCWTGAWSLDLGCLLIYGAQRNWWAFACPRRRNSTEPI